MSILSFILSPDFKTESSKLFKLALPILLAQFALTGLGVIDTIMSGWVGTNDLAAIGLGSNIMLPTFITSTGILLAITPLVSKANGRSEYSKISLFLFQGLLLAVPLGVVSMLILMNPSWLLNLLDLNNEVYRLTEDYLFYIAFGLIPIAMYQALRFVWEGLEKTLPTMWISFFALFLNVPLNALFIYGWGPVEPLGAAGCGVASSIVMWSMFFIAVYYVLKNSDLKRYVDGITSYKVNFQHGIKPILKIGIPNSLALLFEIGMFSFIILFIAVLGATVIAAHQIAISFTSMAFMVPLSLAMALTVRTGKAFGENDNALASLVVKTGYMWAFVIGLMLALISYFLREHIVQLYSFDPDVFEIAITLLLIAALYQVFDALQVSAAGILRGFHDTRVTMWVTLLSYWIIGLGLGYILSFTNWFVEPMGVSGFWIGIVIGLTLAAVLLFLRLKFVFNAHFKP